MCVKTLLNCGPVLVVRAHYRDGKPGESKQPEEGKAAHATPTLVEHPQRASIPSGDHCEPGLRNPGRHGRSCDSDREQENAQWAAHLPVVLGRRGTIGALRRHEEAETMARVNRQRTCGTAAEADRVHRQQISTTAGRSWVSLLGLFVRYLSIVCYTSLHRFSQTLSSSRHPNRQRRSGTAAEADAVRWQQISTTAGRPWVLMLGQSARYQFIVSYTSLHRFS